MDIFINVIKHEYILAFYGVVIYYAIIFRYWKKTHKNQSFKTWLIENVYQVFTTLIVAPAVIALDDEIIYYVNLWFGIDLSFGDTVYITAGPVTDLLMRVYIWVSSKIKFKY